MSDLLNTNITLKGMEDKGKTITLIDTNDTKWQIWKADYKNPSQDSEAYGSLKSFNIGDTFGISYAERPDQFVNNQGKTINFTKRTIYSIMPTVANPTSVGKTSRTEANTSGRNESNEAFGLRLAIHGMVNGLLAGGSNPPEVSLYLPELFELEKDIEMRLNKPASLSVAESKIGKAKAIFDDSSPMPDELPVIQQEDEINVEDIPF